MVTIKNDDVTMELIVVGTELIVVATELIVVGTELIVVANELIVVAKVLMVVGGSPRTGSIFSENTSKMFKDFWKNLMLNL